MTSGTNPPPGTIRLTSVAAEWSEHEHTNPRRLASEVAALLRTLPPTQLLDHRIVTPALFDPVTGPGGLTAAALADYFEGVSQGTPPPTIRTSTGTAPAGAVLIARTWINRATQEAAQRAAFVAGLVLIANDGDSLSMIVGGKSSASSAPAAPPSGSEPGYLQMRQAQQRQAGERSAAEQLEVFEQRALLAEREVAKLLAKNQALEYSRQQALDEAEQERRSSSEERRQRTLLEDKLREHASIIEFMNPENQLSPEPGRHLVAAWCELTKNGSYDVVTETGIGLKEHCRRWLTSNLGEPAEVVLKRFVWALAWPARKKGGMVAKRQTEKG